MSKQTLFFLLTLLFCICNADKFANTHWGHTLENTNHFTQPNNIKPCNVQHLRFVCNITLLGSWETAPIAMKDDIAY